LIVSSEIVSEEDIPHTMASVTTLVCSSEGSEGVNLFLLDYFCARFWFDKASTHLHTGAATSLSSAYKDVKNVLVLTNPESKNLGAVLEQAHKAMRAEGSLYVVSSSAAAAAGDAESESAIKRAIVVAGFTGTEEEAKTSLPPTLSTSGSEVVCFKASRPQWQQGAKQGIRMKLKKKKKTKTTTTESSSKEEVLQVWKLDANDANDLIDEDDVLVDDIQVPAMEIDEAMESAVKPKRKACKNCSCGRKEMEEAEEKAAATTNNSNGNGKPALPGANLTEDQIENPQSACGNCSLGDAFRCASCPYKGMPRFKLGEKIELSSMMLEADV